MKLLFCPNCTDVFNLVLDKEKSCSCGQTKGKYIDKLNAVYEGSGIPIGFNNTQFTYALRQKYQKDLILEFTAFTISSTSPTFVLQNTVACKSNKNIK